jgi:hypothetical protein
MAQKISQILPHLKILLLAVVVAIILGALSEVPALLLALVGEMRGLF